MKKNSDILKSDDYILFLNHIRQDIEQTISHIDFDLAEQLLKDPYHCSFLPISKAAKKTELEKELIDNIQHFLLNLGKGLALFGSSIMFSSNIINPPVQGLRDMSFLEKAIFRPNKYPLSITYINVKQIKLKLWNPVILNFLNLSEKTNLGYLQNNIDHLSRLIDDSCRENSNRFVYAAQIGNIIAAVIICNEKLTSQTVDSIDNVIKSIYLTQKANNMQSIIQQPMRKFKEKLQRLSITLRTFLPIALVTLVGGLFLWLFLFKNIN